jgi:hypothetical protein
VLADLVFAAGVVLVAGWIALWVVELGRAEEVRLLPRWAWALLCVFSVPAGAIGYLAVGRVWRPRPAPTDHPGADERAAAPLR